MEELWQNNRGRTQGFLHKDIVNTVMGCRPVSSRLITIRLRAAPFNITIVQVYAPMSDYDDNKIEELYDQLQHFIDQTSKKDILIVQGNWNAKVGRVLVETGKAFADPSAIMTQMREDSDFWNLPPLTTLCLRTHLVIIKHPEDGPGVAQMDNTTTRIDYIRVRRRFRSGVNIARTRSFPGADIGSDDDLLMMTFNLRLKRISKPKHTRLKSDLKKLKYPNVLETFQAIIGSSVVDWA